MADKDKRDWEDTLKNPISMQPETGTSPSRDVVEARAGEGVHPAGAEQVPPVSEMRKLEARESLRARFPEMTDEDFDDVGRETTETGKFERFIQKLMEKYKWSRGVCQQQIGMGTNDIRDC